MTDLVGSFGYSIPTYQFMLREATCAVFLNSHLDLGSTNVSGVSERPKVHCKHRIDCGFRRTYNNGSSIDIDNLLAFRITSQFDRSQPSCRRITSKRRAWSEKWSRQRLSHRVSQLSSRSHVPFSKDILYRVQIAVCALGVLGSVESARASAVTVSIP